MIFNGISPQKDAIRKGFRTILLNGDIITDGWINVIDVVLETRRDLRDYDLVANPLHFILRWGSKTNRIPVITRPFISDCIHTAVSRNLKCIAAWGKTHGIANRGPPPILV